MAHDPLQGLNGLSTEAQVAVLATDIRNLREKIGNVESDVIAMKRALYGLMFTVIGALIVFLVTFVVTGNHR